MRDVDKTGVPVTCPIIDKVLKIVRESGVADSDLRQIENLLETIRGHNLRLRKLAKKWVDLKRLL